tara:strand:- start:32511 stop:32846 length:336 start_codon:yes stop_codon:yes gene_type:complete
MVTSFSEYKPSIKCPSCKEIKNVHRDFTEDNIYAAYNYSLSETQTLAHYADKQTKEYGKWKCEDMRRDFKTKKVEGGGELPDGMSRMEKPKNAPSWTKEKKKKRPNRRKNK